MAIKKDAWIALGEVARPHGVRGEVRLKLYDEESELLLDADDVLLEFPDGTKHEVSIDGARPADKTVLLKFNSVDDRDRADKLRGAKVCMKRKDFPPLDEGEFYFCDLEGAQVTLLGEPFGTIKEVREYPSVAIFVVDPADGGKIWEIPVTELFVGSVDAEAGIVELNTIEGLERG